MKLSIYKQREGKKKKPNKGFLSNNCGHTFIKLQLIVSGDKNENIFEGIKKVLKDHEFILYDSYHSNKKQHKYMNNSKK